MRRVTVGLVNIDQSALTIAMLEALAELPSGRWCVQVVLLDNGSRGCDAEAMGRWIHENRGRFSDTIFLRSGRNLGASAGRNLILERADGDRILILDNDLVLDEDDGWLDTLWRDMDADPSIGIAGPTLVFADFPEVVQAAGIGLTRLGRVGYLHRGQPLSDVPTAPIRVVASPAACWLMNGDAQRRVGRFPEIYHPMAYWDVDYCMQLAEAGYHTLCDRRVRVRHIVNVTTKAHGEREYARTAVRHGMIFRERWKEELAGIDVIDDADIDWGPIQTP